MNKIKIGKIFCSFFNIRTSRVKKIMRSGIGVKASSSNFSTLELMGPSGIGKSTFFSKASNIVNNDWNLNYYDSSKKINNVTNSSLDEFYLLSLFLKSTELYEQQKDFDKNTDILNFYVECARKDRYLKQSGVLNKRGCFLDDGFCHNFALQIVEIIDKKLISDKILEAFFAGRKFVLLDAPMDYVIKNLKERKSKNAKAGNDWFSFHNNDEHSLRNHLKEIFDYTRKMVELSTQFGATFWILDITKGDDEILNVFSAINSEILECKK